MILNERSIGFLSRESNDRKFRITRRGPRESRVFPSTRVNDSARAQYLD